MSMFLSSMGLQSDLSSLKNDFKIQDMVVASPASSAYVPGMALSEMVYHVPALTSLTVLMAVFIHLGVTGVLQLLTVMAMMFITSVTLSFTL